MNKTGIRMAFLGRARCVRLRSAGIQWFIASLALVAPVCAQQFNIDINVPAGPGAGVPAPSFGAAASQPGTWNDINGAGLGPFPLAGLNGAATAVTLTRSSALGTNFWGNNPGTSGDFELLMDDAQNVNLRPGETVTYTLTGLATGRYGIYTYAWAPDFPVASFTDVSCPAGSGGQRVGGELNGPNQFTLGVTHSFHIVNVTAGTPLTIRVALGLANATLNGIQITLQQSFNVDVSEVFKSPSDGFGGVVNQPGEWTLVSGASLGPFPLIEAHGSTSTAVLNRNFARNDYSFNNTNTTGDFQALLDDLQDLGGGGIRSYVFAGLPSGPYRVITYAIAPDNSAFRTSVSVVGSPGPNPQIVGGPMPVNGFALGVTHAQHDLVIPASGSGFTLNVALNSGAGSLNGVQIRRVRPCANDVFPAAGNGVVDIDDLVAVITGWGPCAMPCPAYCAADTNHNCTVDIDDLVRVITSWGYCQ